MLVLSRKTGESIVLETPDGPVRIMVTRAMHGKVRLGITAPEGMRADRLEVAELRDRAAKENESNGKEES